jgi:hypothetical protein
LPNGYLCGHARDWYRRYSQKIETAERPWEEFKKSLVNRFQKSRKRDAFSTLIEIRKGEDYERYIERFDRYYAAYREESKEVAARNLAKDPAKEKEELETLVDFELPVVTQKSLVKFFVAGLPKDA